MLNFIKKITEYIAAKPFKLITSMAAIIGTVPIIIKGYTRAYKWFTKPKIIWGFFDCPTTSRADFYIKSKSKKQVHGISLYLKPNIFQLEEWNIRITPFEQRIGLENEEIDIQRTIVENRIEIKFELPTTESFRIMIDASGNKGRSGNLFRNNLEEIYIEHAEAKIIRKNFFFT
jgi:hypothetical protein